MSKPTKKAATKANGVGGTRKPTMSSRNEQHQQHRDTFLPPLTGFSDSDSFDLGSTTGSIGSGGVCCGGGGARSVGPNGKIQCICETLKKTHLEEKIVREVSPPLDYIDMSGENWLVTRPKKVRPRDNLRLEGHMDMQTTFHSTYDDTAQKMIRGGRGGGGGDKSKRSTATTTSSSNRSSYSKAAAGTASGQLYLNTRRGRAANGTTMLGSARKRRSTRNRPQTSLKTGGDGYYHTINRDAFKNFMFVNGEGKTVPDTAKLPKVTTKTMTSTTQVTRDDKQKYVNKTKYVKMQKKLVRDESDEEVQKVEPTTHKKIVVLDDEKSYEKRVETIKLPPEAEKQEPKTEAKEQAQPEVNENWTIDKFGEPKKHPFITRDVDNIKDLGLLDSAAIDREGHVQPYYRKSSQVEYRPHVRRLHETSDDLIILNRKAEAKTLPPPIVERKLPKVEPETTGQIRKQAAASTAGHAVMAAANKPFILPQRVHRHKNECSINTLGEGGEMDFTTTSRVAYGGETRRRLGSAQRKRTAGRRYLKSSKRRNLFRQSSDSMFATPTPPSNTTDYNQPKNKADMTTTTSNRKENSTYRSEFDDHLYCPALDVNNVVSNNGAADKFVYTGEASGHKYYLQSNYK